MATRKKQQLDISLSSIKDEAVRSALTSIIRFVSEMGQGIETAGAVKGKGISLTSALAGMKEDGHLFCTSLEVASGGKFKVMHIDASPAASANFDIEVPSPARILGAFGFTQVSGGTQWSVLPNSVSGTRNYLSASSGSRQRVRVINGDAGNTNDFRAVIFYTEK